MAMAVVFFYINVNLVTHFSYRSWAFCTGVNPPLKLLAIVIPHLSLLYRGKPALETIACIAHSIPKDS